MQRQITVLDQNTIDKIAAGEVVERPASVVKELVENAIDAGASAVTVEVREGGISFIRITDNGSGIEKEQVPLAFLRHATSKIRGVDDLLTISSLGFRGEALSSIAAVSQVELITKTREQLIGIRYVIEGGQEKGMEEIGAPDGTTFLIRNLFYNTPARAKFLKTAATEAGYISSFLEQLALSHPHISFKYMQNGQTKLHTSGNDNLKEVIYQIYGRDITKELIEVHDSDESDTLRIDGFIGKPTVSRGNRNFENYYVNGRYVKSKIIMKAIEDAYHTFMMQHKYPFTSLYLTIRGEDVDINVHPTKMEVRFSRQEYVYQRVYQAVLQALSHRELIPEVTLEEKKPAVKPPVKPVVNNENVQPKITERKPAVSAPEPFEYQRRVLEKPKPVIQEDSGPYAAPASVSHQPPKETTPRPPETVSQPSVHREPSGEKPAQITEPEKQPEQKTEQKPEQMNLFDGILLSQEARKYHKIIGQVFDTYWLVQMEDKLYIIDQHAAHEKVLYERIVKEIRQRKVTSQILSPPIIISLNLQEKAKLEQYMDVFTSIGFEIELFGGLDYSIRAVPQNLYGMTGQDFFIEILDHLEESPSEKTLDVLSDRMATMACKAAVKGNQKLSRREAEALIDELLELENPYNCPHGRPTIISMTRYELEKKFKRIV
ncbi:MAG: DNA mismatch repair endonuclease MutL [Oliverpabstia sp.]|nr:DNA mismatch repair endonuclease MutL [Eubacterium sp.]MDY2595949.1 DNA mismatch repair endonuclease MutL [Oliverpabstia sp.]